MIRNLRWLVLVVALVAGVAHANGRERLQDFTKGLKGLDGQFTQRVFDGNDKLKETTSGRVAMSAPRQFRWEYVTPYPQIIVADGTTVWVFDPDLDQASRRPQGTAEQDSPLAALIDPGKLDRDFLVEDGGASDGLQWVVLKPRRAEDPAFESARIGLDDNGVSRMIIFDSLGQRTEISFTGWRRNPAFARETFQFTPPAGVDVIGEG